MNAMRDFSIYFISDTRYRQQHRFQHQCEAYDTKVSEFRNVTKTKREKGRRRCDEERRTRDARGGRVIER